MSVKLPKYLTCFFYRAKSEEDKISQAKGFIRSVQALTGSDQEYRMSIKGNKAIFREAINI